MKPHLGTDSLSGVNTFFFTTTKKDRKQRKSSRSTDQ